MKQIVTTGKSASNSTLTRTFKNDILDSATLDKAKTMANAYWALTTATGKEVELHDVTSASLTDD